MIKTLCIALIGWMIVGPIQAQEQQQEEIRQAFEGYKTSIMEKDGKKAIKWVDKNTREYYAQMLDHAKNMDSSSLVTLPLMDLITVLTVRQRFDREEILSMKGDDFFVEAVNKGMIEESGVTPLSIGKVNIENDQATGQVLKDGSSTGLNFRFSQEKSRWKVDLTSIIPATTKSLEQLRMQQGMSKSGFAIYLLGMIDKSASKKEDLWLPVK
ncbi:hypothetical protein KFE98_16605 [bacterium SCSIO 12741]|nr:hypothetical protein KFE98_16605 [bacterium SCSIO 12741]